MDIVVVHSRTKRRISGGFQLIGTREDLISLEAQIHDQCACRSWSYGTIDILAERQGSLPNQEPRSWDD